ncbi:hypothetical protein LTR12_009459 [Friedmanniomyces endolithicus]|nr:hypothetical protein LTR74_002462 [Friedmanniomyces endolithicus]KAK1816119.1 hypothetical protein LTR12_009459 [Friedmanniomyces endolithicus]
MKADSWHMQGLGIHTNTPYDHVTALQPGFHSLDSQQSSKEEWQQILERVSAGDNDLTHDYTILGHPPAAIAAFDPSPRQSIETSTAMGFEPQMFSSGSNPALYPFIPLEPQFGGWTATSEPSLSYPPAIPEHEQWSAPPASMMPNGLPASAHMHPSQFYYPQEPHFTSAGPSPMLSQGSPHDSDFMDVGWDQPDVPQPWLDSSGSDEINDIDAIEVCYAQLLWRCLKEAPEHTMTLKELYDWVREHSQKAKDPKNRGWQNSVRHNLSMNAAFERVPPRESQGVKKGSLWRLTPAALRDGVISTTRYRKDPKHKPLKRATPALKRQISGAKGGQATRNAQRRQQQLREARSYPNLSTRQRHTDLRRPHRPGPPIMPPTSFYDNHPFPHPFMPLYDHPPSPYFLDIDDQISRSAPLTPPRVQMLYDTQPKSMLSEFNFGHIDFTNGGIIGGGGEHEYFAPDTPSLGTEASYMSDDGMQSLLSHNASREPTSFPVDV